MSYCVNPNCPSPDNQESASNKCGACGSSLWLRERYRVRKALGKGGFGATFIAQDDTLPGKPLRVIKQLRPSSDSSKLLDMARQLFEREATTLGKIGEHPQVPALLDFFEENRQFYLVEEYVRGPNLKQEVQKSGVFDEEQAKKVLRELLPVLKYLHRNNVIHRDIKPANIIRRLIDDRLVLIDFGAVKDEVSQTVMANAGEQSAFTSFAIGTPGFSPPEQMALRPVYASDIYALGMTCVYLLAGQSPRHLSYDARTGELQWRDRVQVSHPFATVLEKMLAVSLEERYVTADEALADLEARAAYPAAYAPPPAPAPRSPAPPPPPPPPTSFGASGQPTTYQPTPAPKPANSNSANSANSANSSFPGLDRSAFTAVPVKSSGRQRTSFSQRTQLQNSSPSRTPAKWSGKRILTAYHKGQRDFDGLELSGLNLQQAILSKVNFRETDLSGANLRKADLSQCNLTRSVLARADLRDANLQEARLSYANLVNADLRGADLSNAYLLNATLDGANLCGANLKGATIADAQLAVAQTNWRTIRPDKKRR